MHPRCRLFTEATKLTHILTRHASTAATMSSPPPSAAAAAAGTTSSNPNLATEIAPRFEKSLNQVTLLGRVGVRPQLRGSNEHPVTVFTVATNVSYKYQTGDIQQKTEWHRVSVFKPFLRDTIYKYLAKGQRVLVQGKLVYGQVTDAGGTIHTTATIIADDVVFFNKPKGEDELVEEEEVI